jgi:uncharacterized BrkB/YihY/UPF0761 family membrane protein
MNKVKRTAALIGVGLILSMYLISLISAFFATEQFPGLFLASVFSTVVIPIMIYLFITLYKYIHKNDKPKTNDNTTTTNGSDPENRL